MRENAATKKTGQNQSDARGGFHATDLVCWWTAGPRLRKVKRAELQPRAVVSGSDLIAATDSFSRLADSVANSFASADPIWFVFWVKLNLIFLGTFVASAITGMRGKGKGIGVVEQLEGEQRLTQGARGDKEKGEFLIEL